MAYCDPTRIASPYVRGIEPQGLAGSPYQKVIISG
jgi:hypothetical protein